MVKHKNFLLRKYRRSKKECHTIYFDNYNKALKQVIDKTKRNYFIKIIFNDNKKINWLEINKLLRRNKSKADEMQITSDNFSDYLDKLNSVEFCNVVTYIKECA